MEQNITVGKRDNFRVTRALVPCAGFKLAAPPFLRMVVNVQNNLDKSSFRTVKAQEG
ncbi:TPA: hypothetical protein N5L20_002983 [Enterobacter kobei]|uniref:hypothetical protein n=1 Tax=Enterobacter TaxID=547 RepID=UPI0013A7B436|nr:MULTISPECIES: hypothetical protein [Enterobacter]MCK7343816.1 hypothetical protein [Enterobacter kobei]QIB82501.1 hypothetical protein G0034_12660 [Enterobacter sp. T2]HCM9274165.1 hypothetical protein [Enterobacter kobei]